jgi:hypothetical protein
MSPRKIVTFTTFPRLEPPARRTRSRFVKTCSAWASKLPTPTSCPFPSIAAWPEIEKLADAIALRETEGRVRVWVDRDLLYLHGHFPKW